MQRKLAVLFVVIILSVSIGGFAGVSSEQKITWCMVAEASENEKAEKQEETGEKAAVVKKEQEIISEDEIPEVGQEEQEEQEEAMLEEAEESEIAQETVFNVSFPTNSKAYLDPDNLSGRGQIFSDEFKVENYGNTDVAIKINNIEVFYKSTNEVYEFVGEEIRDESSRVKKLNVDIVWKNEKENMETVLNVSEGDKDEYVLFLNASEYDENDKYIKLNDGSTGMFYFTGTLNSNPEIDWEDGEITISFDYEIVSMVDEEEEPVGQPEEQVQYKAEMQEEIPEISGDVSRDASGDASRDANRDASGDYQEENTKTETK